MLLGEQDAARLAKMATKRSLSRCWFAAKREAARLRFSRNQSKVSKDAAACAPTAPLRCRV